MDDKRWIVRRWITAGDGLRLEMDDKRWIPSGDGSRPDMDRDRIWMVNRRWLTGDRSRETDNNQSPSVYEDIEVMRSYTILEITTLISNYEVSMERRYACIRCTGGMAPPSTMPSTTQHYSEHYSEIPNHAPACPSSYAEYDPESDPELQQQCRYRTSLTRLIFGGATILREGDDSAGFATTLNANNYRTGSAGTKHRETHSPIEKASNDEKCMQGM
jgi:hypothetical protein